jgi:hypothetical protein
MRQGYIKLWRKALDNDWLKNHELWAFWCYCLLRAKHEPGRVRVGFQDVHLEAGQFIFGRAQAARDLGMTEWKIRQCLDFLKRSGNLASKTASKFSIISIINWDTYQGSENGKPPAKPPATRQQPATKKNDKNDKKKNAVQNGIELDLSSKLLSFILKRRSGFKKPDLQKWAGQVDLMIRVDGRDPNEIERVIEWSQGDSFWQNNILSTAKLRAQFDKLALQMQGQRGNNGNGGARSSSVEYEWL